ncbi:DUF4386 domain-containing protein [Candidatus Villigracilis saccharophilus]|uniref:DUF4386 domain-containing protein n=1 Tax=Candidatus Villigracilis saccharophilus TaxID=3140684 RepID=UPI003134FC6C|nr:DUF4386 domain-containing protein [Anaerolineales bacterium]
MAQEYQIRIEGHLGNQWADWFDGFSITLEADGKTLLSGPVPDQPALYGLLRKVRDLGMPLISVNQVYSIKGENIMDTKVNTYRTTAKVVGALYIMGFIVGIAGSVLGAPGQLDTVSARSMMIAIGALLWVIAAAGDAAHGVMMFPILKQNNERVALGYLSARLVEAAVIAVSALFILLQIPLGAEFLKASASEIPYLQSLSTLFAQSQAYTYQIGMVALGMAGLSLCYGFYRAKLVPQFFVIWGFIGYVSFLLGSMLEVLGFNLQLLHTLPGGLWEMSIGVWLIVKGFNSAAFVFESAKE